MFEAVKHEGVTKVGSRGRRECARLRAAVSGGRHEAGVGGDRFTGAGEREAGVVSGVQCRVAGIDRIREGDWPLATASDPLGSNAVVSKHTQAMT